MIQGLENHIAFTDDDEEEFYQISSTSKELVEDESFIQTIREEG